MKRFITISLFVVFTFSLWANYNWSVLPQYVQLSDAYAIEAEVGLYFFEGNTYQYEGDELIMIHTLHKKVRVNTRAAIGHFNKIAFSMSGVKEVLEVKARAIKPNGMVVLFDENNIKELQDDESSRTRIFAIDGIEVGDDVEYLIIRKMEARNFGQTLLQFDYPFINLNVELKAPSNLIFEMKGYNGVGEIVESKEDSVNQWRVNIDESAAIQDVNFASFDARRKRIEYRLDVDLKKSTVSLYTWEDAAIRINKGLEARSSYSNNVVDEILSRIDTLANEELIVKSVERLIKREIYLDENLKGNLSVNTIWKRKITNKRGLVKLMGTVFQRLGIPYEVVLTSNRTKYPFDGQFMSWNYLDEYLIYFPHLKRFLSPDHYAYRLGEIPWELSACDGLFVQRNHVGDSLHISGVVKYIEPSSWEMNYSNLYLNVNIDVTNQKVQIETERCLKGLCGGYYGEYYERLNDNEKINLLQNLVHLSDVKIPDRQVILKDRSVFETSLNAEFVIDYKVETPVFLEVGGGNLLLKIGELIGNQVELYRDEQRDCRIENSFNRWYYREIVIHVPDGYRVVNENVVDVKNVADMPLEPYAFIAKHDYADGLYKVVIDEYYKEIYAPSDKYEEFRKVVNGAADFNKIVLVLEKE